MAVDAVCPHCDTRFHLHAEMQGQAVRCPECKDVFVVAHVMEPKPREVPYERIEETGPPPVLEQEIIEPPQSKPTAGRASSPAVKSTAGKPTLPVEQPAAGMPAVREVKWSRSARPPSRDPLSYAAPRPASLDIEPPKTPRDIWPWVLTGLIVAILLLGGGAVAKLFYDRARQEDYAAADAAAAFKERNYPEAANRFQKLLADFPQSRAVERYRFFESLSTLHALLAHAGAKEDPTAALEQWNRFCSAYGTSPLTKPDESGFGVDVFDAGRKLLENLAAHAELLLSQYRAERTRLDRLSQAEQTEAQSRRLLPTVERFRPRDVPPLDELVAKLSRLNKDFAWERRRLEILAPYRNLAANPVEEQIADFEQVLARHGLSDDAEGRGLIAAASAALRKLMTLSVDDRPQQAIPQAAEPRTVVAAWPVAGTAQLPAPVPDAVPETVITVARGWLYAFDFDRGLLLWSTRVGAAPAPLRTLLPDEARELLLVPSWLDGRAAISARRVRTGELLWQQALEAPAAGSGAALGNRLYLPLANSAGTLIELDITSGHRLASFNFRQRLQGTVAAVPGSRMLAVVAEARRIFLMNTSPRNGNNERQLMRLAAILRTDHPPLSIRVPPLLIGPMDEAPRSLVLFQHDGARTTRVRAFALPEFALTEEQTLPAESTAREQAAAVLPGHVVLPAACDGERIAVVTDLGAFAIYQTNAPGSLDRGLFALPVAGPGPLPGPGLMTGTGAGPVPATGAVTGLAVAGFQPMPAVAVFGDEGMLWLFARGSRSLYQFSITPESGFRVLPRGAPVAVGFPIQPPHDIPHRDAIAMTFAAAGHDSIRLTLLDRATGQVRWERLLGGIAVAPPLDRGGECVLMHEHAAIERLTPRDHVAGNLIAPPLAAAAEPARIAAADQIAWCILPLDGGKVLGRQLDHHLTIREVITALPAAIAGEPATLGETVILPLADGFLYCFDPAASAFIAGPAWRHRNAPADARCLLACHGTEVFASDGLNRIGRWNWPHAAEWNARGPGFELRAPPALPPLIFTQGTQTMLLTADREGVVSSFLVERPAEPVRRWRPAVERVAVQQAAVHGATLEVPAADAAVAKRPTLEGASVEAAAVQGAAANGALGKTSAGLPSGVPSHGFVLCPRDGASPLAVYAIAGRALVAIDPEQDEPAWVRSEPPGEYGWLGLLVRGGHLYATDLSGHVLAINAAGQVAAHWLPNSRDRRPVVPAAPIGESLVLPLDDGTTILLPRKENAP